MEYCDIILHGYLRGCSLKEKIPGLLIIWKGPQNKLCESRELFLRMNYSFHHTGQLHLRKEKLPILDTFKALAISTPMSEILMIVT